MNPFARFVSRELLPQKRIICRVVMSNMGRHRESCFGVVLELPSASHPSAPLLEGMNQDLLKIFRGYFRISLQNDSFEDALSVVIVLRNSRLSLCSGVLLFTFDPFHDPFRCTEADEDFLFHDLVEHLVLGECLPSAETRHIGVPFLQEAIPSRHRGLEVDLHLASGHGEAKCAR